MKRQLISVSLLFSLLFPIATSAKVTVPTFNLPAVSCTKKSMKDRPRCITDAQKNWERIQDAFDQSMRKAWSDWKKENGHLGAGNEYQKAMRAFSAELQKKRDEFSQALAAQKKAFYAESAALKKSSHVKSTKKRSTSESENECSKHKDSRAFRICVRLKQSELSS